MSKLWKSIAKKHVALPSDHGTWVFLFSPLIIGLVVGGRCSRYSIWLIVAALAAFLLRQPVAIYVKIKSGRRRKRDLLASWFWMAVYALIGLVAVAKLVKGGFSYVVFLAIPGVLVFLWHLKLVSQRSERKQVGVEIVASGMLALSAPAAYCVGIGRCEVVGFVLFILVWLQSAASIVYAYLRLEQRNLKTKPGLAEKIRMGKRALLYAAFNVLFVLFLSVIGRLSGCMFVPFLLQFLETAWGTLNPAIGEKPTRIGLRQLAVSSLFTLLFIIAW